MSSCPRPIFLSASPAFLSPRSFTRIVSSLRESGKYVSLKDTIQGFKMIVSGECDHLPEQAFYMVGTIDEAMEKAKKV